MTAPWRLFPVEVVARERLSPTFTRITFGGEELDAFADNGFDQRIKLVLPADGLNMTYPPTTVDWYAYWRGLPDRQRNPIRTYTVRAVRQDAREVDVDVALHGEAGPASRWAATAVAGHQAALVGPDARFEGVHGGVEFKPGPADRRLLLAGDETAVPAILSIVERLPAGTRGAALLEVPYGDDALPVSAPPGLRITWLARDGGEHGHRLAEAVREEIWDVTAGPRHDDLTDVDVDHEILWEVPTPNDGELYAWLAGEAGVIRALRRFLVGECGLDRRSVAFMGYWRLGRCEENS